MNNETDSQTQSITATNNPLDVSTPQGASDAKDFQQAAGVDTLQQTKTDSLQVVNQGQPIQRVTVNARSVSYYIVMGVLVAVTLLVIKRLIRWVKAAPSLTSEPAKIVQPVSEVSAESSSESEPETATVVSPNEPSTAKSAKKSKKTSRSKHKAKK